jgi:hypothetical protein
MIDRHTPESWDDELDRQLREALSVDPSPDFRSRVRARLDAQPVSSPFGGIVFIAAAAAAAAGIAVTVTMSSGWWTAQSAPARLASRPALLAAAPYVAPVASRTIEGATPSRGRGTDAVQSTTVAGSAVPGRLVTARFAPEERAAFHLFVGLARTGRFPFPESLPLADGGETLPAIEVPPIEIPPVFADLGEGVSQ